jgi:hypothetical protein
VETVAVRVAAVHRMSMSRRSSGSMSVTSASTYDAARLRPRGVLAATRLEVLSRIFGPACGCCCMPALQAAAEQPWPDLLKLSDLIEPPCNRIE